MTTPNSDAASGAEPRATRQEQAQFRRTLVKVLAMQVGALLVFWWLQARYTP